MMANSQLTTQLRVASWNVLSNWWYVYKYYNHSIAKTKKNWPHRKELTKQYIRKLNADILTLQEINPNSFDEDFCFMRELGYDGIMEDSKNKWMRCAIYFRRSKIALIQADHKAYKCVVAQLQVQNKSLGGIAGSTEGLQAQRNVFVTTCHLSAKDAGDRVRQLETALKVAQKMAKKSGIKTDDIALLVCGDCNTFADVADSPVRRFMLDGIIKSNFKSLYPVCKGGIFFGEGAGLRG